MSEERKSYDSDDNYSNWSARLTKDAQVFGGDAERAPLVRLTFVSSSRMTNNNPKVVAGWIDAKVRDFDANLAQHLMKGDTIGVEGKPYFEEYNGKLQLKLDQAKLHISVDMLMKLKERGFTPGAKGATKTVAKSTPNKKPTRAVQDVDFGDDE